MFKGKGKKKNKAISLAEFHSIVGNTSAPTAEETTKKALNWADEMEKLDDNSNLNLNSLIFSFSAI